MASHGLSRGLSWSRLGLAMRPCGLPWHLHWPLLVSSWPSNASIWPPMASPLASLGLVLARVWARSDCEGANYPRRPPLAARWPPLLVPDHQERLFGLPNSSSWWLERATGRAPPRTGLRPGPGNSIGMGWAAGLQGGRISSDDVLKAFTLWGFSESTYISRALWGRAPGVPVKCPIALLGPRLEPGKLVQIIMSELCFIMSGIMFYYVQNYVREFCANLNQTGWFK